MIKLKNVSIKYVKDYYSLFNINLQINENTLLLGNETSGNNFLLRLVAKIDKVYEGEIFIDNDNLKQIKDKDLNLAYVPKIPYLFENKSVLENLIYPLKIRKINKNEAILRAKTAIKPYFLKIFENFNKIRYLPLQNKKTKNNNKTMLQIENLEVNEYTKNNNDTQQLENKFENFLKTKVKKLDASTKKIIVLLRAKIRAPKYILIENFFENLDENYLNLANEIISNLANNSTIIATQNDDKIIHAYKNFKQIVFDAGSIKR